MDDDRFDTLTRLLVTSRTRRQLLGTIAAGLSLGALLPLEGDAKKNKNNGKKKKKLKRNEFGCVNVGGKCRGKDANCCSGICQGKKPKKGKKDKSRCIGHDGATCQAGQREVFCGGPVDVDCTTSANAPGFCDTTTGNAPYCVADGECFACNRDTDCQAICGPQAACIRCQGECDAVGGTACVGPQDCVFGSA